MAMNTDARGLAAAPRPVGRAAAMMGKAAAHA